MQIVKTLLKIGIVCLTLLVSIAYAAEDLTVEDSTGTDPRDFSAKFMPYYRHVKLDNGIEIDSTTFFGMIPFSKTFAMTYEIPFNQVDIGGLTLDGTIDPPFTSPIGIPPMGITEQTGLGDLNLRFFTPVGRALNMTWIAGVETWLPTHTQDILGADRVTLAPLVANILDLTFLPMPGAFLAMMHFYEFDVYGDSDESHVSRYKGRWFFMIPLSERFKLYNLTEMQPIYDFINDNFSFWVGPEFGTGLLGEGIMVYIKPGWGIDPNTLKGDRDYTLELGFRYFIK